MAEMYEGLLELEDFGLFTPYVRLTERADAMRQANAQEEQVGVEQMTPSGVTPDQFAPESLGAVPGAMNGP